MKNKIFIMLIVLSIGILFYSTNIYAASLTENQFTNNLTRMISDLTTVVRNISLAVSSVVIIICLVMCYLPSNDEMSKKKWKDRIKTVAICCVLIISADFLLDLLLGYFR